MQSIINITLDEYYKIILASKYIIFIR